MLRRLARVALLGALLAGALTACTPEPEPTPTFPFATEAEAFAAAEATYRAYVDALNAVDLSDPATFEDVYAWTTGEANANERRVLSQMHADGWTVEGETTIVAFSGTTVRADGMIGGRACSDVSAVTVLDPDGQSTVSEQRPDRYEVDLTFEPTNTPTQLAISSINAVGESCS